MHYIPDFNYLLQKIYDLFNLIIAFFDTILTVYFLYNWILPQSD
jgi:hypothetical protein